jgi:hypothetical protein
MISVEDICSNFDLEEDEIAEFIGKGKSDTVINETPDSVTGDLSRLTVCVSDPEPEQKE